MEVQVYPFSFSEYLEYYEISDDYDKAFDNYVRYGGMPGAYEYDDNPKYDYVQDVFQTVLIRDLVAKYKIRNKSFFIIHNTRKVAIIMVKGAVIGILPSSFFIYNFFIVFPLLYYRCCSFLQHILHLEMLFPSEKQ